VASLSQGRTAAAQCGLFTHKSVPVIFEPPCIYAPMLREPSILFSWKQQHNYIQCLKMWLDSTPKFRAYQTYITKLEKIENKVSIRKSHHLKKEIVAKFSKL